MNFLQCSCSCVVLFNLLPQTPAQFNNKSTMNTFESFLVRFLEIFPNKKVRVKNVFSLWESF